MPDDSFSLPGAIRRTSALATKRWPGLGRACAGAKDRVRIEQPSRTGRGDLSFARIRSVRPSGGGGCYHVAQRSGASARERRRGSFSLVAIGAVLNGVHRTAASRQPSWDAGEHFCGKRDQAWPARLCGARTGSSSAPGSRPGPRPTDRNDVVRVTLSLTIASLPCDDDCRADWAHRAAAGSGSAGDPATRGGRRRSRRGTNICRRIIARARPPIRRPSFPRFPGASAGTGGGARAAPLGGAPQSQACRPCVPGSRAGRRLAQPRLTRRRRRSARRRSRSAPAGAGGAFVEPATRW